MLNQFAPEPRHDDEDEITVPCARHHIDGCQHKVQTTKHLFRVFGCGPVCKTCQEQYESRKQTADPNHQRWLDLTASCPLYRDTNIDHPKFPKALYQSKIETWGYGPQGLYLYGPSRFGKTRSMMLTVKRMMFKGHSAHVLFSDDISLMVRNIKSERSLMDWRNFLTNVNVLAVDDLFAERMTDAAESFLFGLIDARMRAQKPTLITANRGREEMMSLTNDAKRCNAFFNRLAEVSTLINFNHLKTS